MSASPCQIFCQTCLRLQLEVLCPCASHGWLVKRIGQFVSAVSSASLCSCAAKQTAHAAYGCTLVGMQRTCDCEDVLVLMQSPVCCMLAISCACARAPNCTQRHNCSQQHIAAYLMHCVMTILLPFFLLLDNMTCLECALCAWNAARDSTHLPLLSEARDLHLPLAVQSYSRAPDLQAQCGQGRSLPACG